MKDECAQLSKKMVFGGYIKEIKSGQSFNNKLKISDWIQF